MILLLMGAFPLAAAANSIDGSSYSGDDAYAPAAGGFPELYTGGAFSLSGDDAYDLAPGGNPDCALFARLCFQYSDDSWPGWDRNNAEVVLPV